MILHPWKYNQRPVDEVMHLLQGAYGFVYLLAFPKGKFYIGKRTFANKNDWYYYYGSGLRVQRYIKKHGKENIRRYIILLANSKEELNKLEEERIKAVDAVNSPHYLNIAKGGEGAGSGEEHFLFGKNHREETKEKMSEAKSGIHHPMSGRTHSEETKAKIRKSMAKYRNDPKKSIWLNGSKHPQSKYHGKRLRALCDNLYNENKQRQLYTCMKIIIDEHEIEYGSFLKKSNSFNITDVDARSVLRRLLKREQIELS